ncbi:hypothetical protein DFH28DRAFT_911783, partial [Melampsora americana]
MPPDASDTGQMNEDESGSNSTSGWKNPTASTLNDIAVETFLKSGDRPLPEVEITSDNLGATPKRSEVPLLAQFAKKRARASTPGLVAQEHVQNMTGTPRTERMARLFPGCEEDRSLTDMLSKLVTIANDVMQLPAKGRLAKQVHIDVDSCADILVLINAAFDQHQVDQTKKILFNKPASALAGSKRAFDFQFNSSMSEKLDALAEQVSLLVADKVSQKKTTLKTTGSYAAAASKGTDSQRHQQKTTTQKKPLPKQKARKRLTNTVTLVQTDKSQIALGSLSVTQLIQGFNMAFRTNKVKVNETSESTITVKTVQRHPSNDLVLHLESSAHAGK